MKRRWHLLPSFATWGRREGGDGWRSCSSNLGCDGGIPIGVSMLQMSMANAQGPNAYSHTEKNPRSGLGGSPVGRRVAYLYPPVLVMGRRAQELLPQYRWPTSPGVSRWAKQEMRQANDAGSRPLLLVAGATTTCLPLPVCCTSFNGQLGNIYATSPPRPP